MIEAQFIIYVSDQGKSTVFYENLFQTKAILNVPGMTEFLLAGNFKLGLMPENGISKILGNKIIHPKHRKGIPACELYFVVENAADYASRAVKNGAKLLSALEMRDWGDKVVYFSDIDGHILAFAERKKQ